MNWIEEVIQRKRRFAVFPMVCADHCAYLLNINFAKVATSGEKLAEVLEYGYRLYKYDMVLVFSDPYIEAEAMGCKIEFAPYPRLVSCTKDFQSRIRKKSGLETTPAKVLRGSDKRPKHNRIKEILKAVRILKRNIEAPIFVSIKGPFSLACFIGGMERFLKLLLEDNMQAQNVVESALDFQLQYLDMLLDLDVNIMIGDPMVSTSVISPALFKEFAFEPLKVLITKIRKSHLIAGIHICGEVRQIINELDNLHADILSIEDITLKTKTLKMGGVSTNTILNGSVKDIRNEIENTLSQDHLILSTSCDVPVKTPSNNIKRMIKIAREIFDN